MYTLFVCMSDWITGMSRLGIGERNTYKPIVLNICDESEKSGKPKSFEQKKKLDKF